jgi:putative transcriptional regulator
MQRLQACLIVCLATLMLLLVPPGVTQPLRTASAPAFTVQSWETEPAAGMFLVAQRGLDDPFFGRTVILLLSHSIAGSEGLIVNQRSKLRLSDVLADIDTAQADNYPLFFGGPLGIHQVFMLLHKAPSLPRVRRIAGDIYFSDSRQTLEDMLASKMPASELQFYHGYASWTTGQLAVELARGSWHLVKADADAVFGAANEDLWERMINKLEPNGIEVQLDPLLPCCLAARAAGSS